MTAKDRKKGFWDYQSKVGGAKLVVTISPLQMRSVSRSVKLPRSGGTVSKRRRSEDKKLLSLWNVMDADGSGHLTIDELKAGFAKSGAEVKDRLPESEIVKTELSVPAFDSVTSSPSASFVVISNTFV